MSPFVGLLLALSLAASGWAGVQRKTPAQHAQAGWEALNAGRLHEAAAAFEEGLKGAPQTPSLLFGAGLSAHLLGQGESARRYLLDALRYEPSLTAASLLLGELLYRADDVAGAIQVYEHAKTHAPAVPRLLTRLEAWRRESNLHDTFARKLGDHFTVLFEGPAEADLAAKAVEALEAAYWRIGSALYIYPVDVITVVLYTREQFRDVTRAPDWAGGAYDGRIRVPVLGALNNTRELERVLAHEFTHALVRSVASRGVPQWFDEGLAVNFEGSSLAPHLERVRRAESRHELSTLERPFAGMNAEAAALAYAQSATTVKRLLDEIGSPAVVGILTDVGRGLPFAEAFERHANMTYAEFKQQR